MISKTINFANKSIISIADFSKEEILYILDIAKKMDETPYPDLLKGKILATLFFEPSTRTRLSFESAMNKLGGRVIGFASGDVSSLAKGESLTDSVKIVEGYADVIVMRHYIDGAARAAAEAIKIPVINGGDGTNQHPTQTFLDLYTILKSKGSLENLHIGFLGDLKYGRTVHSLAKALSYFNAKMYFISPSSLRMPKDDLMELKEKGIEYVETKDLLEVSEKLDILYSTRIQKERFSDPMDYEKVKNAYILKKSILKHMKKELRILHPLPRINELNYNLDETENAIYFEQAHNGIPVRKALLALVLGAIK